MTRGLLKINVMFSAVLLFVQDIKNKEGMYEIGNVYQWLSVLSTGSCVSGCEYQVNAVQHLFYEMPVHVYTPEHNAYPYNYMIGDSSQRKEAVDYLKTAIEMGKEMGAEYTLISTGHAENTISRRQIQERLVETLRELAEYAQQIQEPVLLETLTHFETNVCTNANDLQEVLEMVDSQYLYGMCDVVVPSIEGESVMDYFMKLGDRCRHLHLVDCDGNSETHVIPGDGELPLPELLEEIQHFGYHDTATIELVTAYIREPYVYAKRAHDRVRQMMLEGKGGC